MTAAAVKLSKTDFLLLEQEGRWSELIEFYEACQEPSADLRAATARAYQYLQNNLSARQLLDRLSENSEPNAINSRAIRCRRHLTHALKSRQSGDWTTAYWQALRALSLAKHGDHRDSKGGATLTKLGIDAQFDLAIAQCERGQTYLALSLFDKCRRDPRSSQRIRRLSAANQAMCLWDLGQASALETFLHTMPELTPALCLRLEILLAMFHFNSERLQQLFMQPLSENFPANEQAFLATLFLEWLALEPRLTWRDFDHSWVVQMIQECQRESALGFLPEARDALLEERLPDFSYWMRTDSWRTHVDLHFLGALLRIRIGDLSARDYYKRNVDRLLNENRLNSPLVPLAPSLKWLNYGWANALKEHVGPDTHAERRLAILRLCPMGHLKAGEKHLDFSRSPMAKQLLKRLAQRGGSEQPISKQEIHKCLTGNSYSPDLHDARIYKLVARMGQQMQDTFGLLPWTFLNDNHLHLNCRIEHEP